VCSLPWVHSGSRPLSEFQTTGFHDLCNFLLLSSVPGAPSGSHVARNYTSFPLGLVWSPAASMTVFGDCAVARSAWSRVFVARPQCICLRFLSWFRGLWVRRTFSSHHIIRRVCYCHDLSLLTLTAHFWDKVSQVPQAGLETELLQPPGAGIIGFSIPRTSLFSG
jgi:hypothetical protein